MQIEFFGRWTSTTQFILLSQAKKAQAEKPFPSSSRRSDTRRVRVVVAGKRLPTQWPQDRRDDSSVPTFLSDERVRETVRVCEDGARDAGNGAEDGRGDGRDGAEDRSRDPMYEAEDRSRDWTDGTENGPRDTVHELQERSEESLGRAARAD